MLLTPLRPSGVHRTQTRHSPQPESYNSFYSLLPRGRVALDIARSTDEPPKEKPLSTAPGPPLSRGQAHVKGVLLYRWTRPSHITPNVRNSQVPRSKYLS